MKPKVPSTSVMPICGCRVSEFQRGGRQLYLVVQPTRFHPHENSTMWPFTAKTPPTLAQCIANLNKSTAKRNRLEACQILGSNEDSGADVLQALNQALDDQDDDVRKAAAMALANFGDKAKDAIPKLIQLMCNDKLRLGAALAKFGRAAVPYLIRLVYEADHFARVEALFALEELGPLATPALPVLRHLKEKFADDRMGILVDAALEKVGLPKLPLATFEEGLRQLQGKSICSSTSEVADILFQMWILHSESDWLITVDDVGHVNTVVAHEHEPGESRLKKHRVNPADPYNSTMYLKISLRETSNPMDLEREWAPGIANLNA